MTIDPKLTILGLIKDAWSIPWSPAFTADWFDQKAEDQQVVVTHLHTRSSQQGFSEQPSQAQRRYNGVYMVDLWSVGDETKRWTMIDEVDRIIGSKCDSPGGDLEFLEVSGFRDLDEVDTHPRVYRSQLTLEVLYYG